ncbi:MAG: phosphodiesterase [Clostridia bacterium]|nr:phosphodiesterase [Clostridia bacterium]
MKLLIASDIHGDAACCQAMLDAAEKENAEKILILGDILYHGPRNDLPEGYAPKKVIELLNPVADKLLCVRGNCDTEVDQMVLSFPVLSDTAFVYDSEAKLTLFMSHGHKYSPDNLPPLSGRVVFLYGHTHLLGKTDVNGVPCVNPGSVSLPKGGNSKTYAVYENGCIAIKDFDGKILESHCF